MRYFFILLLLLLPGISAASENLIENLQPKSDSVVIIDGVIYQQVLDSRHDAQWKFQSWHNNDNHIPISGNSSYFSYFIFFDNSTGFFSRTFTTPEDVDILYFRLGLNGKEHDTTVTFDIKDVMPNTTYTIQWRVLNSTAGEVAWTDMRVVRCDDGYALELGDENCSRACDNQSVTGGYISPDAARVYEPEMCTYQQSNLVCDDGWGKINDACEQMCTAGISRINIGGKLNGLYARKIASPALCVKYNDSICYGHLTPGGGAGLNVNMDGTIYHLID